MVGRTLAHYRIVEKLGEGGMGVVYKAHDTHLDRAVAVKVLPPGKVADQARKQRFVREAKAASALNHPNIVTIHEIRSESDADFMVMEYVEGKTLDEIITPRGLRPAQALAYAVQIADALAKAHAAGIIHRDLKPSNVIVTGEGRVKVLDFGLAKLQEPRETTPDGTTVTALTEQGSVMGTPAYMSPEQAEGRQLDARSDILSFGSVLYEMATGRRAFSGERVSILNRVVNEDPSPPRQLAPAITPELEKIILRCLRKDPARRYQTMADLKVALEDLREESGSAPQAQQTASRRRWAWAAAVLTVVLAAAMIAWRAWSTPDQTEPLRAIPLSTQPGVHRYPSFSPDGNHVAFSWTGPKQDNQDIYVQQIGTGSALRLTSDPRNDYNPVWSPDGRSIAFLRRQGESGKSELRLIAPLGGPERMVTEIRVREVFVTAPYVAWCAGGNCLVITDSPGEGKPVALFVVSLDSGERKQLTSPQPPAVGDSHPAVSLDGKWLVFRRSASLFSGELMRLGLTREMTAVGEPHRLTPASMNANYPGWIPGADEILFSAQDGLWRLRVIGESSPARLPFVGEDGVMPAVSRPQAPRSSRLVYVRSLQDHNIWRIETSALGQPASSPPVVSISSTRLDGMPQLSPDGRRVAFASNRAGSGEIWLSDVDGSNAVQLVSMGTVGTGYPHWSPDGRLVVFHSNRGGQVDVYLIPAAGGKPRNMTSHPARDAFPSFSRDGKWIYFSSNRTGEHRVWKMPATGGGAVEVTENAGYNPIESPDGVWLYYVQTVFTPGTLWRVPASGGVATKVVDNVLLGNFVVFNQGIYYVDRPSSAGDIYWVDRPSGETRLQYFNLVTRKSTTVARNLGSVDTPITASADGRTILFPRLDSSVDDLMLVENFR